MGKETRGDEMTYVQIALKLVLGLIGLIVITRLLGKRDVSSDTL